MKKLFLILLLLATPCFAANTPPPGNSGDFIINDASKWGALPPTSAFNALSGQFVDPRASTFGSNTCTGYYQVGTNSLGSGGSGYAVGDTFILAASTPGGNAATGHVTGVSGGVVTTYALDTLGGGYNRGTPATLATTATSGSGTGLTITVTNSIASGNDDATAFNNASIYAVANGKALMVPPGCWISSMNAPSFLTMMGTNLGVDYGFTYQNGGKPKLNVIGSPSFVINLGTSYSVAFANFEVNGFSSSGGPTTCIGSASTTGGLNGAKNWFYQMSTKGCTIGLGNSFAGQGNQLYVVINSDFGATSFTGQQSGMYGAFSDTYIEGNTCAGGGNVTCVNYNLALGFMRILNNRFEYTDQGIVGNGWSNSIIANNQFDHMGRCIIKFSGADNTFIFTGNTFKGGGLAGSLYVTGTANNGSGLIRLTVASNYPSLSGGSSTGGLTTGDVAQVSSVGGTTEANGTFTITVVDGTHIDLQGSTFVNPWTSGGFASVRGKDADICFAGTSATASRDFHFESNTFTNSQTGFTNYPAPAYVAESTTSGANNDYVSFIGGQAHTAGGTGPTAVYDPWNGYSVGFANWISGAPTHLTISGVSGTAPFSNDGSLGYSINSNGTIGIGTTAPAAGMILDLSGANTTANSSLGLPVHSNGTRPTCATAGQFGYNTSSSLPEFCNGSSWFNLNSFPVIAGSMGGLTLSNDGGTPNTIIDIASGAAASDDATVQMNLASAITKTTGSWTVGSGNGCLDTGSVATSTWYHVFLIERTDTAVVDALCSTSATSPTMPANYTVKRRIGSFKTDGSANILAFTQVGSVFYWGTATLDVNTAALGTSAALQTLNVPPGVKVTPLCRYTMSKDGNVVILTSGDETDVAPSNTNPISAAPGSDMIDTTIAAGVVNTTCPFLTTNTSQQIRARGSAASTTLSIVTRGWID